MPARNKKGRFVKGHRKARGTHRRKRRNVPYQLMNPHHRRRRRTAVVHRRTRRRRNPSFLGGSLLPPINRIGAGAAGAIVSGIVPGYVAKFAPQIPRTGPAGMAVRAATGVLLGKVAQKFMGRQFGEDFALGALIAVADEAFGVYAAPYMGMGSYLNSYLNQYMAPGASLMPEDGEELSGVYGPDRLSAFSRF
jgi:hypothetical protein